MYVLVFAPAMFLVYLVVSQPWPQKPTVLRPLLDGPCSNEQGRGIAELLLPPSLQCYEAGEHLPLLSQTEPAAFDSALLGRTGMVEEVLCIPVFLGELSAAPPGRRNCWASTKVLSVSRTVLTKWKLEFKLPIPVIGIPISRSSASAASLAKQRLRDDKSRVLVYAAIAISCSFQLIRRAGAAERCLGWEQGCGFGIPGC